MQTPLLGLVNSPIGLVVIYFCYMMLWGFGIHSASIMNPILEPLFLITLTANAEAVASGGAMAGIMTKPFLDSFMFMGGAGNMLALVIAILLGSRRADYRTVAKVGLVPAMFNISEPIMFGLPVVMNPVLIIPMILATLAGMGIGALSTSLGIAGYTYIMTPWVTPPVLGALLSTGGSVGAALTAVVILVVAVLIYMPFVKAMDREVEPAENEGSEAVSSFDPRDVVVAFDMDGTLLDADNNVTGGEETVDILARLQRRGCTMAIGTGRLDHDIICAGERFGLHFDNRISQHGAVRRSKRAR